MTRTQLYLPQTQYEELKRLAAREGKTFAHFARELLEDKVQEIKRRKKVKKNKTTNIFTDMLASQKDLEKLKEPGVMRYGSTRHDEYLYGDKGVL